MNGGTGPRPLLPVARAGRSLACALALVLGLVLVPVAIAAGQGQDQAVEARAQPAATVEPVASAPARPSPPPGDGLSSTPAATGLPDLAERLAACASCHGRQGEGVIGGAEFYPHLAGKPAGYLLAQMQAFRDGRRHYPRMVYLMQYMDDAWLAEIAYWYAAQPARAVHQPSARAPSLTAARRERAEQLVFRGDPGQELPSCAACHGDNLAGLAPGVPALTGLPADYLIAQFGGWVTGMRRSKEPDCMADIARRLEPADVSLLAHWLAAQPAQPDLGPAPAGSWHLPITCGPLAAGPAVPDAAAETAENAGRPMQGRP